MEEGEALMVRLCPEQQGKMEFTAQTTTTLLQPAHFKRTDCSWGWLVRRLALPSLSCSQPFRELKDMDIALTLLDLF